MAWAQNTAITSPDRSMDWTYAGADTSVKSEFQKTYNVLRYGLVGDGKFDNDTRLRALLQKAKPYSILYFPKGQYYFASSIDVPSNILIKGAGIKETKLTFQTLKLGQRGAFNMASYDRLNKVMLTKAANIGDQKISVASASGYKTGDILEIYMENDSALMYTQARWETGWAAQARGQIIKVTKVNTIDNTIELETPIRLHYALKDKPAIQLQNPFTNIGFEDFTIENLIEEDMVMFYFREARNCWINNVQSLNVVKHHVLWEASSKCSVTNCVIMGAFRVDGGGHGYGVACSNHTSDCLVENSVFQGLRHALMTKKGANGNVFVHNYCLEGKWDHANTGRPPATISIHGHYSYLNLFEGNVIERITSADFWGPSGPGTSFVHNIITTDDLLVKDYSKKHNIIGNVTIEGKIEVTEDCEGTVLNNNTDASSAFYYKQKPAYMANYQWPITHNWQNGVIYLPAQERYINDFK